MISARSFIRRLASAMAMLSCAGAAPAQGFIWNAPILDRVPAVIGVHKAATASDGDTALILNLGPDIKLPKVTLFDTALGRAAWEVELPPTCLAKAYEGYAIGQAVAFAPDGDVIALSTTVGTGVACVVRYARNDGRIVWQTVERPAPGDIERMDATRLAFDAAGNTVVGGARRVALADGVGRESWRPRATTLDRHTGNPVWTTETPLHPDRRYRRNAQLAATTDGRVYLLGFYGGATSSVPSGYSLTRLDSAGLVLWERSGATTLTGTVEASEGALGALADGSAIVTLWLPDRQATGLHRFDAVSGNTLWSQQRAGWAGALAIGPGDEVLLAGAPFARLNIATGLSSWELPWPGQFSWSDPVMVGGGRALLIEGSSPGPRSIRSLDLAAGTMDAAVPMNLARPGGAATNFVAVHGLAADAASGRASFVAFVRVDNGRSEPSNVFATSIEGRSATVGTTIDSVPTLRTVTSSWSGMPAVAVTGDGDIVGMTHSSGTQLYFKLAAGSGVERWRLSVAMAGDGSQKAFAAIGADGDFVDASARLTRRSGVDGHVLWSVASPVTSVHKPLVDAAGNIIVFANMGSQPDPGPFPLPIRTLSQYAVAKFSGADGSLLWQQNLAVSRTNFDSAQIQVAVDAAGRPIATANGDLVAGGVEEYWDPNGQLRARGVIARIDPGSGTVRWRKTFPVNGIGSVAAFPNADLAIVGSTQVIRVSGETGDELWRQPNTSGLYPHVALVDAQGHIAFGEASQPDGAGGWLVASVDGSTGLLRWSRPLVADTGATGILHLAQTADGTLLAAGRCIKICIAGFDPATGAQRYRLVHEYPGTTYQSYDTRKLLVDGLGRVYAALTAPGYAYAEGEVPMSTPAIARLAMPADDALFADSFE